VGARLLDRGLAGDAAAAGLAAGLPAPAAPPAFRARPDEFLLLPLYHIYGSDERSMYTPGVAGRAPAPYIALGSTDADRLGLAEGDWLQLWQPWMDVRAPLRLVPSLPDGVAGLPAGLPGLPFLSLPGRGRIARTDAPPAGQAPASGVAWAPTGGTWTPDDTQAGEASP